MYAGPLSLFLSCSLSGLYYLNGHLTSAASGNLLGISLSFQMQIQTQIKIGTHSCALAVSVTELGSGLQR